jgi:hypothetical protein
MAAQDPRHPAAVTAAGLRAALIHVALDTARVMREVAIGREKAAAGYRRMRVSLAALSPVRGAA